MLHLGDDLLKEATPEVVALSGASEEEVNQVFIIRGLGGEICRFRRPGRSLTVKGDDRTHDDTAWIILKLEDANPPYTRETIRLLHDSKEITAPFSKRGNTDFRKVGPIVELSASTGRGARRFLQLPFAAPGP